MDIETDRLVKLIFKNNIPGIYHAVKCRILSSNNLCFKMTGLVVRIFINIYWNLVRIVLRI